MDVQEFIKGLNLVSIQDKMLEQEGQFEPEVEHIFSGGVYLRQMFIPAGTLIMGKRHRHETCNVMLKGKLTVYTEEGGEQEIEGPLVFTSPPNTKKLAYCHEDTVFINIHPTEETDLDLIEKHFIITEEEYQAQIEGGNICLGAQ